MPTLSAPNSAVVQFDKPNGFLTVDCSSGATAIVSWSGPGGTSGQRTVRNISEDVGPFIDGTTANVRAIDGACIYESSASSVPGDGLLYGRTVVAMGNSIIQAFGTSAFTMGPAEFAQISSGGALQLIANVAVSGAKVADITSVQLPLAVASGATDALVMENSNVAATGTGISVAQARADWRILISGLQNAGIRPIIIGGGPRATRPVWSFNLMLQRLCEEMGVVYVYPWSRCVAAGEVWTKTLDGTHPHAELCRIAGQDLWASISNLFTGTDDFPSGDTSGFFTNCMNATNVSGVPTGWTGAAGVAHSCSEAVSARAGNWWTQTATNISTTQVSSRSGISLPAGSVSGDLVRLIVRMRTAGFEAAGNAGNVGAAQQGNIGSRITLSFTGGTAGSIVLRECCADIEGVATAYGVIPAGSTGCTISTSLVPRATVSGALSVQIQAQNLSLMARV